MEKLTLKDLKTLEEYEGIRDEFRRHIIDLKKRRRLAVGEYLSFVFENRETALFQIQEMLRTEHIRDRDKVQHELDIYNDLIPGENELSATLFIELVDDTTLREWLPKLIGVEEAARLEIGDAHVVRAVAEAGRSTEEKTATVHYLRFPFAPEQRAAFLSNASEVYLVVEHPHYRGRAKLAPATRASLGEDLG